jgi:hypothetical protein
MAEDKLTKRQFAAAALCYISNAFVSVMAVLSGLGVTVAIIVLAINGTISVGAAILLSIVGVPVVGTVAYWVTAPVALALMGIAKLLDREVVTEWLDSQPIDDY